MFRKILAVTIFLFRKIHTLIMFLFKYILVSGALIFLMPIINIMLVFLLKNNNTYSVYCVFNILLATNACFMTTVDRYFQINKEYNEMYTYIKDIGIAICISVFCLSTILLELNLSEKVPTSFYYIVIIITTLITFVLNYYSKKENDKKTDLANKTIECNMEAKVLAKSASELKSAKYDGKEFNLEGENNG